MDPTYPADPAYYTAWSAVTPRERAIIARAIRTQYNIPDVLPALVGGNANFNFSQGRRRRSNLLELRNKINPSSPIIEEIDNGDSTAIVPVTSPAGGMNFLPINFALSDREAKILRNASQYTRSQLRSALRSYYNRYYSSITPRVSLSYRKYSPEYRKYISGKVRERRREAINRYLADENLNQWVSKNALFKPRMPRKPKEDYLWFWDYSKIRTTAKNPVLRLERESSDNRRYKKYLRDAMREAAKSWITNNPGSNIVHGFY